jgi:signal peptidase I
METFKFILRAFIVYVVSTIAFLVFLITAFITALSIGLIENSIAIAGSGSMYPTIPKGKTHETVAVIYMKPYPSLLAGEIKRGDLISAESESIRERIKKAYGVEGGVIKRVIAVSGDRLMLKDGMVIVNGVVLHEPYIAGSTRGADFLKDNEELVIPQNKIFIMGDNRKESFDSRHYGFIGYEDVDHVLAFKNQIEKISLAQN